MLSWSQDRASGSKRRCISRMTASTQRVRPAVQSFSLEGSNASSGRAELRPADVRRVVGASRPGCEQQCGDDQQGEHETRHGSLPFDSNALSRFALPAAAMTADLWTWSPVRARYAVDRSRPRFGYVRTRGAEATNRLGPARPEPGSRGLMRDGDAGRDGPPTAARARSPRAITAPAPVPLPPVLARADEEPFVGRARGAAAAARPLAERSRATARPRGRDRRAGHRQDAARVAVRGRRACRRRGRPVRAADEESVWPYQPFVEALRYYAAHRPDLISDAASRPPPPRRCRPWCRRSRRPPSGDDRRARAARQLFEAVVRVLLHAADPEGCCWSSKTCTGPTPLPRCCSATSCAGGRERACSWWGPSMIAMPEPASRWTTSARRRLDTLELAGLPPAEAALITHAPDARPPTTRRSGGCATRPAATRCSSRSCCGFRGPRRARRARAGGRQARHRPARRSAPSASLETLTLAAVLGNEFSLTALQAVAPDREQDELIDVLEAAVAAGLIVEDPVRSIVSRSPTRSFARRCTSGRSRAAGCGCTAGSPRRSSSRRCPSTRRSSRITTSRRARSGCRQGDPVRPRAGAAAQTAHAYETAVEHYERVLRRPAAGRPR